MKVLSNVMGVLVLMAAAMTAGAAESPYWYEAMKKVNAGFDGNPCYVAQFGDSITYASGFWKPLGYSNPDGFLPDDGFPKKAKGPEGDEKRWRDVIKGAANKGPDYANYSGWKIEQLLNAIPAVLKRDNPEVAIIMIGTNGTGKKAPPNYRANLEKIIQMCLDAHCIPILNTIPPKRDCDEGVAEVNQIVREVAQQFKVPLVDYHAEIVKRQPAPACFGTLISKDGVHPTSGDTSNFSEENLKVNGNAVRTWSNFLMFRELYFRILNVPRPFVEQVGTVEPVREGIRCEVTADTQVSKYVDSKTDERLWNWGAAGRLKAKGSEEYVLLKFDTSKCKGMAVKRATLYLSRTEQCVINVAGVSTISADWAEGKGKGEPGKMPREQQGRDSESGATFTHAVYPKTLWGGPGSNFKSVVYGQGGSLWQAVGTGWAKDDKGQAYYTVELPAEIAQALLIEDDSHGLAVVDEKGQRAFQTTYRQVPNPNHFLNARESGKPCFLVIEGEKAPSKTPAAVTAAEANPGAEAGDVELSWVCPAAADGGKVLGYRVYVSRETITPRGLAKAERWAGGTPAPTAVGGSKPVAAGVSPAGTEDGTGGTPAPTGVYRLPRALTWRPGTPGGKQSFPVQNLEPGADYSFAVVAYDRYGNESAPVIFGGKAREARKFAIASVEPAKADGTPAGNAAFRVWACASGEKINPLTGNAMSEGQYAGGMAAGVYRNGNEAWDGKRQCVTLTAGRNDFAGFQLAIENLTGKPLAGLRVSCSDLTLDSESAELDRHVRMSAREPERFMAAMEALEKNDAARAAKVYETINRYNALKAKQQSDIKGFMDEMKAIRAKDEGEYKAWMGRLGGEGPTGGGIAAGNVEIFWQWNLKDKAGMWYPDALVPIADNTLSIPNAANGVADQKVQALYVDVWVPHKAGPGRYRGELRISGAEGGDILAPVELTVLDYQLPDELNYVCDMNGYQYPPAKDWEGALNLHRLAHRNRLNINIVPYSQSANWSVSQMGMEVRGRGKDLRVVSFEKFDQSFGPLLNGSAFETNPRAGVPVAALFLNLFENWPCTLAGNFTFDQTAQRVDIRDDFSQDYKDGVVAVCRQMAAHFKLKGYTRTAFQPFLNNKYKFNPDQTFWLLDEPMFRDDYLALQFFGDLFREGFRDAAPLVVDYRADVSRAEEARGMLNRLDTMVFSQSNIRAYPTIAREFMRSYEARKPGEARKAWEYGGAGSVKNAPVSLRGWVVESWLNGMDGLLPWQSYGTDASWTSAENANDSSVFYPAMSKWNYNGAYGSLKMKGFRDGQQDAECLLLLAKKLGATRAEIREALKPYVDLKGEITAEGGTILAEAAGSVSYRGLTPDAMARLRKAIGLTLEK